MSSNLHKDREVGEIIPILQRRELELRIHNLPKIIQSVVAELGFESSSLIF